MNINKCIDALRKEIYKNKLVPKEDAVDFFDNIFFDGCKVLIVQAYGGDKIIIPSLSFYFEKSKKEFKKEYFESVNKLFDWVGLKEEAIKKKSIITLSKHLDKLYHVKYYERHELLIASKHKCFFKIDILEDILELQYLLKRNSLNLLNTSYKLTVDQLSEIKKGFSPSIKETAIFFSTFFENKYNCISSVFSKSYLNGKWVLVKENYKIAENLKKKISEKEKLLDYKKSIYFKFKTDYILVLPFINDLKSHYFKHFIVLIFTHKIPRHLITNYTKFVNNYFNAFLEKEKRAITNKLQNKIITIQENQTYLKDNFNPENELSVYAQNALDDIVIVTNAFSGTFRWYDIEKKSLVLKAEGNENGEVTRRNITNSVSHEISIEEHRSVNVMTFRNVEKGKFLYIEDTTNIGLQLRENSKSELCFPVYFKNTKIGVLNFESPELRGFNKETIQYLKEITGLIEHFYIQLLELNDKLWLSKRSQIYQNFHELESTIKGKNFPLKYKKTLLPLLEKQQISIDEETSSFNELNSFINEYFNDFKKETLYENYRDFKNSVQIRIDEDVLKQKFKKHVIDSVLIIIKNIVNNQRKFSNKKDGFISININNSSIFINNESSMPLSEEYRNKYLYAPYQTGFNTEKRTHFGLFVIGMLVRQLGGYSYVYIGDENTIKNKKVMKLKIRIPISKAWI